MCIIRDISITFYESMVSSPNPIPKMKCCTLLIYCCYFGLIATTRNNNLNKKERSITIYSSVGGLFVIFLTLFLYKCQ